jgi:iron complex transport system substrate-binding protein
VFPPNRIVCLTEETVEILYSLGQQDRIVGISGYTVRPPEARREKPRVSAFVSADLPKITALQPDLVLAFSDIQADIVAGLVRAGLNVHVFNQRSVAEILDSIRLLGAMVGVPEAAAALTRELEGQLDRTRQQAAALRSRPRVYFEEWDEPQISAIRWVSELIEIAGGTDVFADRSVGSAASARIVTPGEVIARRPEIIIGSWCGKKFQPDRVKQRAGFDSIPAVMRNALFEIKSPLILQPGPAALTDGLARMREIIHACANGPL